MAKFQITPCYSERFVSALQYAADIHSKQIRKQGTPYIAHLLQVSGLVLEVGGSEDEAIAALLHDAMEDLDIPDTEIHRRWGREVCAIVAIVSENKNRPQEERKQGYVEQLLDSQAPSAILVSAADKLHNLRCYANEPNLWTKETADFYNQLIPIYEDCNHVPKQWVREMENLLEWMSC